MLQLFLVLCSWITPLCVSESNRSPIVGIVSQPYYDNTTLGSHLHSQHGSEPYYWIPASYVKWLESAGARSIPIPYHASKKEAENIFYQVNGLLFPGGGSGVPEAVQHLWNLALQSNENGTFFPIWGTCLGFEYMVQLVSETRNDGPLKSGFKAENVSLPLMLWSTTLATSNATTKMLRGNRRHSSVATATSRIYANSDIRRIATSQSVTMNNHERGVEPHDFLANKALTDMFVVTSVNRDLAGRPFVSTIESKQPEKYPYFGVQYHPEKNAFEYGTYPGTDVPYQDICHSPSAIQFSLHLAQFFVNLTKKSLDQGEASGQRHACTRPKEYPLVNSYELVYTNIPFEQVYVIPDNHRWTNTKKRNKIQTTAGVDKSDKAPS